MADPFFHELPAGVSCRKLAVFKDGRGILAEVYREAMDGALRPALAVERACAALPGR